VKSEYFAIALLMSLFSLSLYNGHCIEALTEELSAIVSDAGEQAKEENWDKAEALTHSAIDLWHSKENYTHVILRHSDTEAMEDDFYELLEHILNKEHGGTESAVMLVNDHLESIRNLEKIRLGSVF